MQKTRKSNKLHGMGNEIAYSATTSYQMAIILVGLVAARAGQASQPSGSRGRGRVGAEYRFDLQKVRQQLHVALKMRQEERVVMVSVHFGNGLGNRLVFENNAIRRNHHSRAVSPGLA